MYNVPLEEATQICDYRDYPENATEEELNAFINEVTSCFYNAFKNEKIYFEKYYYTIDTTQLDECNQSLTPLEKVTKMLAGAEIKNSAENPVNLNEHLDPANNNVYPNGIVTRLAIKNDTFGDFLNINLTRNFTGYDSFLERYGYKEENFPSNSELGFEVTHAGSPLNYYEFSNYPYKRSQQPTGMIDEDNICIAGNVSGIFYKSIMDEDILRNEFIPKMEACNNSTDCFTDLLYVYYKNNIFKLEKWYWTIDTSLLEECK